MSDETPTLRPRGLASRLVRVLERHADHNERKACQGPHCPCYERARVKLTLLFWAFLLVAGTLARREVLSYVPPLRAAPPPVTSGARLPGLDPAR